MKFIILFLLILFPLKAYAAGNIVIDLAQDHVDVTTGFTGERVTVFGSADQDGDVAIVLKGPESRIVMRKKQPSLGIWLNGSSVNFKHVPLFYDYAVSRSEDKIANEAILKKYGIGLNSLNFEPANYNDDTNISEFQEALVRTRQTAGMFPLVPSAVNFVGQRLFKSSFYLPANVPVGKYEVEGYLFHDGNLIDSRAVTLDVAQAGASADILNFAVQHGFFYALSGLTLAAVAGFIAFWMSRNQRA